MNMNFVTVRTADLDASIAWYERVLGFRLAERYVAGPGVELAFLDDGHDHCLELITQPDGQVYHGGGIALGFTVPDLAATETSLRGDDVEITFGPATMPSGIKLLRAKDCHGLELIVIEG